MKRFKTIKFVILSLIPIAIVISCTNIYKEAHNWDSFIEMASSNGANFFSEATAPNGSAAYGGSKHNQADELSSLINIDEWFFNAELGVR